MRDNDAVEFEAGQDIDILTDYELEGDNTRLTCNYKALPTTVKPGDTILIAEGALACEVLECFEDQIKVKCKNTATIGERKNMNLPGCNVDLPTLTEQDEKDLQEFGIKRNIDIVAASFVRKASDIEYIREVLGPKGSHIKIIAKIENQEGLKNFDNILEAADGILVARGELGMEIPPEKVFLAQKWMVDKCNLAAKPVIAATQLLESMIHNPRPTRSEASDLANAVLDGVDCLMLSGETANGEYPINAVSMMAKISSEAEKMLNYSHLFDDVKSKMKKQIITAESVAASAASAALNLDINLIICRTDTGRIARLVAKYRPEQPILACSSNQAIVRQMNLTRGITGLHIPDFGESDDGSTAKLQELMKSIIIQAKALKLCEAGHKIIAIHGSHEETPEESNVMEVINAE